MANNDFNGAFIKFHFFTGNRRRWFVISIAAAVLGYLGFSLWGGGQEVLAAFIRVGLTGILIALGLSLVNYSLRFLRWQLYLSKLGYPVATLPSALIYIAGFSLTTTPGKAGEILRGVFLKERGISYTSSTAAFVSERLSDLVAIVLLTLLGLAFYPEGEVVTLIGLFAVGLGLLMLSSADLLIPLLQRLDGHTDRLARTSYHLLKLLIEARHCHSPLLLLSSTFISLLAWSAEAYAFYLIVQGMGIDVSIDFAFYVYALSMLVGALSFLPGGLGSAEAVMIGLLIWSGMPEANAVAATIIIRLATLWFAVALGGVALLLGDSVFQKNIFSVKN